MVKRILFFGTSHVGALKSGLVQYAKSSNTDHISCHFVGISGPQMVVSLQKQWKLNGSNLVPPKMDISFFTSVGSNPTSEEDLAGNAWGVKLSPTLNLNLKDFDEIVFVDMFYRYPGGSGRIKVENGILSCGNVPISANFFNEMKLVGVGGCQLPNHKEYGNIPYQESINIIKLVMKGAGTQTRIKLLPAPRPMLSNCNIKKEFKTEACLKETMNFYEINYIRQLKKIGVEFIPQPKSTICPLTGLTLNKFSRGKHPVNPAALDAHGNSDYGEICVRELIGSS